MPKLTSGQSGCFPFALAIFLALPFQSVGWAANPTPLAVVVRHAPNVNGGTIEGSLQQLTGESATLNGGAIITGDWSVPGLPTVRINGRPHFAGILPGNGSATPTGYPITLNGNVSLGYLRTRTTPATLPTVSAPPQPGGTRTVTIHASGQSIGDPATLRNLTLNGNASQTVVPPGTYGNFTVNSGSGLTLGISGATQPVSYHLQNLTLNGQSRLDVVGPIILTVANGFTANGLVGTTNRTSWLQLQVASGGFTLNGGGTVHGQIVVPAGTVIVNGNSLLAGSLQCDRLTVNAGGIIRAGATEVNVPPVAFSQSLTNLEDTPLPITLLASDVDGDVLQFQIVAPPTNGSVTFIPSSATSNSIVAVYHPATNFNGADSFQFTAFDGSATSAISVINITVKPVNDAPTFSTLGVLADGVEDLPMTITHEQLLAASDATEVDGDPIQFELTPLSGTLTQNGQPIIQPTLLAPGENVLWTPATNVNGAAIEACVVTRVFDGQAYSTGPALSIRVNVAAVNDPPVALAQSAVTDEDTPVPIILSGWDADGDALTFTVVAGPSNGTLTGVAPNLIYRPNTNYNGADAFTFTAFDGSVTSAISVASLTVNPVNDAPFITAPAVAVGNEDAMLSFSDTNAIVISDVDAASGQLQLSLVASNGVLTLGQINGLIFVSGTNGTNGMVITGTLRDLNNALTNLTYLGAANWFGTDTLTLAVNDQGNTGAGGPLTATQTIVITVTLGNHRPVAYDGSDWTMQNNGTKVYLWGEDADGDPLTYRIVDQPQHGKILGNFDFSPPRIAYIPDLDFNGQDIFTFVVNDGTVDSQKATMTVDVWADSHMPLLFIRSPGQDAEFTAGQPIPVQVQVDFDYLPIPLTLYADGQELTTFSAPPYELIWSNATTGSHRLTAVAYSRAALPVTIHIVPEVTQVQANAGPDQLIVLPNAATLTGAVKIPSQPVNTTTNVLWTGISGPGTVHFSSATALTTTAQFDDPGLYVLQLGVTTDSGTASDTVQVEVLPTAHNGMTAVRSNEGKDFWLTFLNNYGAANLSLVVASRQDGTGEVEFFDFDYHARRTMLFEVKANTTTVVPLKIASDPQYATSGANATNAIHVTISTAVSIYGLSSANQSADGFLALPKAMLGTNYIVFAYGNTRNPSYQPALGTQFAIVGTEDNTKVKIIPSVTTGTKAAGVQYEIALQKGATYRLINTTTELGDLTGTSIVSDRPVAVFGGHQGAYVPDRTLYADHLVEQIPPVSTWGRQFVTLPLATRSHGDTFRILSSEDHTSVSINGRVVAVLNRGQFIERLIEEASSIVGNQPILVAQFANGSGFDGSIGDPFMTLVPAVDQYGGSYLLSTPRSFESWCDQYLDPFWFGSFANLIVPTAAASTLMVDGFPATNLQFTPIGSSGFVGVQIPVTSGAHAYSAQAPFGLTLYGWGRYTSYGFPGGLYSDTIELGTHLTLEQPTRFSQVNTEKVVVAKPLDARGNPVPDLQITFQVTGANPASGQLLSDQFGEAVFAYHGTNEGIDVITASVLDSAQRLTNTWLAAAANQTPVVQAGADQVIQIGQSAQLHANIVDDGQPANTLVAFWRAVSGPVPARFLDANAASTTVQFDLPGHYVLELSANDTVFAARDRLTVTVTATNIPPTLVFDESSYDGQTWFKGDRLYFQGSAYDWDGKIVRVELYDGDTRVAETPLDTWGEFKFEWVVPRRGLIHLRVSAVDDRGASTSKSFTLTAKEIHVVLTQMTPSALVGSEKWVRASITDDAGLPMPGQWIGFSVSGAHYLARYVFAGDLSEATFAYASTTPGTDIITATVYGYYCKDTVTNLWLLTSTNLPPVVNAGTYPNVYATRALALNGSASDDGYPSGRLTYSWRVLSGPGDGFGVVFSDANALATTVTFPQVGDYQFELAASDSMFGTRSLTTVHVSVFVGSPPAVTWLTPTTGQSLAVGQSTTLTVQPSDPDGVVTNVAYYFQEGTNWAFLGHGAGPQFTLTWTPQTAATAVLLARATDNDGLSSADYTNWVTVVEPSTPDVVLVSPSSNATLYVSVPVYLEAYGTITPPAQITRVEYFVNAASVGMATNEPFWLPWTPPAIGAYQITATAYADVGTTATSPAIDVTVALPQPQVSLVSPANGQFLNLAEPTLLFARLTDLAGAVTNLEFFVDGAPYLNSAIWYVAWTPAALGQHTLQVFANDRFGQRVGSAPITVTVAVLHPPTVALITPTNGATFAFGSVASWQAQASDSEGAVTNLVLEWDGQPLAQTNGVVLEMGWTNASAGWHWLVARATDDTAQTASTSVRYFVLRPENPELVAPSSLSAESVSSTEIKLTWPSAPTQGLPKLVIVERWDPVQSAWVETGSTEAAQIEYASAGLNPETTYRYRVVVVDANGARSGYSPEAQATTRTAVPTYSVIDITKSLTTSLLNQQPVSTLLTNVGLNNFDPRRNVGDWTNRAEAALGTNAVALKLAVARFKERWPQIQLDFDPVLVTPKSILPRTGFLTGAGGSGVTVSEATAQLFDPNDPYRPIKAFLQEHRALFGLGPEALGEATVPRDYAAGAAAIRTVVCQQQVAGVPVFGALLIGHLTPSNELAALSSQFVPFPSQAADPAMLGLLQSGGELPWPAPYALVAAVTNVGEVFGLGDLLVKSNAQGQVRKQVFSASAGIKGDAYAELAWFPSSRTQLRLCWQVLFTSPWRNEMYLALVAADTGEVLLRRSLTTTSSDATYRVFTGRSPAPMSPGWPAPNSAQPPLTERSLITLAALHADASPQGWIADGVNETRGNNVNAYLDRNDDDYPDPPQITGNPWRVFDFPLDLNGSPDAYRQAATVQLFYWNNWMHDALYSFGFTEAAGNFQFDNFGRGGFAGDEVWAEAQDGSDLNDRSHRNNANMSTPPDGFSARMQMYLFDGSNPGRDGSLDAEIILHEYTHGLSGRLVGGGAGIDALATAGLGEGWSDFYALALLSQAGEDPDGAYPMGAYVTYQGFGTGFEENYYYGIRRYPYCTDTNNNPLTFKDIDPWQASPHTGVPRNPILGPFQPEMAGEVHHQGEVWGTLLWEVRASLVKKHGFPQGNNLALQLMTDGMRLCPPNPNWVQARDAILLADRILTDAANEAELWTAFAKRGLGYSAKAPESYGTSGVQEGYDLIRALAVERVEVLGGNGNGSVEPAEDNDLVIHLANHGSGVATQVIAKLSTGTPGVTVLQALSAYADIAQGQARTNTTSFQIRTDSGFVNGTAIDLVLVISSASTTITNGLRLYGGVPGTAVLLDTYSALGGPPANTTEPRYLTPLDLDNMEPLWMSENVRCLLKSPAGPGRYLLWRPDGDPIPMVKTNFTAHRLTRDGVVVGRLELDKTPVVLVREDVYTNQLNQVQTHRVCFTNWYPHTIGVKWVPGEDQPVPLTSTNTSRTNYLYQFPKASLIYTNVGMAYLLANNSPTNNLGFTFEFPTLNDVWDLAPNGVAVGGASVYVQPLDDNSDGQIDRNELEFSICEQHRYGSAGLLNWLEVTERDFTAGYGINVEVAVNDNTLLTTAVQFNADQSWRWVGPVSFRLDGSPTSIGLLAGGHNSVVGCGAVFTGDPAVDAYSPTHAFRFDGNNEFGAGVANLTYEATPVTEDLGTLPGGLYSFPRAVSPSGEIVGYSSYDQLQGGGNVSANPYLFHGVYWAGSTNRPEDLGSLGPMPALGLPRGFSDAYAINSHTHIAGTALRNYYTVLRTNYVVQPINEGWQTNIQLLRLEVSRLQKNDNVLATNGASAAVLWQINHNTNGQPFWEIADLNGFVTDTNADLMTAVGINDDEVVLARKRLLRTASGQGDKSTISTLLLRFETVSRDRFLAGSFRIPHGFESVELEFVNPSTAENLGRYSDLLGGGATRVFDAVTDLLKDESATQSENQRVWFVKNPDHPRQIDFYTCFNGVGAVEIRLYLKGHYVGPVKHTLERAEDFAFIIDYVNDWVEGVGFNVDESAPPPMMGFSALPGASGTRWINNLSIPCLIPFFNVISPASGFTQVQNTAALAIGLFDGVKNGVNDDYQFVKLLIGGSVTATGWMAQQEYTELQKWRNPRQRAIELKAMQDRICEELVFRPLAGVAQDLTTWDGFKKRAWQGWDGIKRGGSAVWALDLQIKIALAQGVVEWANDWVDRMVVGAEKASWDAAPWNGNAFLDEFMTVTRQSHYTAGYTFGYVSEQVFLLGGLTKVANGMVKGGVQLAGTLTARTGFTVAARCHLLKQYLTSVALSIEMRVAIERGLVDAAKRPLTSVERRTAAEIIESRLAEPGFNRAAFGLKDLVEAATLGKNISRLFLIAAEEGRFFHSKGSFLKLLADDATPAACKGWIPVYDRCLAIEGDKLLQDRANDMYAVFKTETPEGRKALREAFEDYYAKTQGIDTSDYSKVPLLKFSRIGELYQDAWRVLNRDADPRYPLRRAADIAEMKRTRRLNFNQVKPMNEIAAIEDRTKAHYFTTEKFNTPDTTRDVCQIDTAWSDCKVRVKCSTPQLEGNAFVALNADNAFGHLYDPLSRGHPIDRVTGLPLKGGKSQFIVYGDPLIDEIEVWDDTGSKWIRDVWDEATQTWIRVN